jgi:hypothetical protein
LLSFLQVGLTAYGMAIPPKLRDLAELGAVPAWTVGASLVSSLILILLLQGKME